MIVTTTNDVADHRIVKKRRPLESCLPTAQLS
jgi:hypothetical protein